MVYLLCVIIFLVVRDDVARTGLFTSFESIITTLAFFITSVVTGGPRG